MSDFDLCKETLVGKRIIFLGSSVTYGACAMGQSFIEALEENLKLELSQEKTLITNAQKPQHR